MNLLKRTLIRALPLTVRIDSALKERGFEPEYDFETEDASESFFFDDGRALRSLKISSRFQEVDPSDIAEILASTGYFQRREENLVAVLPAEGGVCLYWPAEKTPLERLFGGSVRNIQELLPATETTSVSETVQTEAPAEDLPAVQAESRVEMHEWHGIRYGVAGSLRGGVFRKSYLLQRQERLCFAMMAGDKKPVAARHQAFVDFLKSVDDWPSGHKRTVAQGMEGVETLTLVIDRAGHCRFFCAGIQPLYWSGRLRKLMRFPNTEEPLNSRLHEGDAVLLIPGGWTAREAAELREIFLYKEKTSDRMSAFLDYAGRGRGILIECLREGA